MSDEILMLAIQTSLEHYDEEPQPSTVNFASLVAKEFHSEMTRRRVISESEVPEDGQLVAVFGLNTLGEPIHTVVRWSSSHDYKWVDEWVCLEDGSI